MICFLFFLLGVLASAAVGMHFHQREMEGVFDGWQRTLDAWAESIVEDQERFDRAVRLAREAGYLEGREEALGEVEE